VATITTTRSLFQAGQTVSVFPWPGDWRRNVGEPRPAAITTAAAGSDGSFTAAHASILAGAGYKPAYLVTGPRWPAGGAEQQVVSTAA
jgi:hypothetical protein